MLGKDTLRDEYTLRAHHIAKVHANEIINLKTKKRMGGVFCIILQCTVLWPWTITTQHLQEEDYYNARPGSQASPEFWITLRKLSTIWF